MIDRGLSPVYHLSLVTHYDTTNEDTMKFSDKVAIALAVLLIWVIIIILILTDRRK